MLSATALLYRSNVASQQCRKVGLSISRCSIGIEGTSSWNSAVIVDCMSVIVSLMLCMQTLECLTLFLKSSRWDCREKFTSCRASNSSEWLWVRISTLSALCSDAEVQRPRSLISCVSHSVIVSEVCFRALVRSYSNCFSKLTHPSGASQAGCVWRLVASVVSLAWRRGSCHLRGGLEQNISGGFSLSFMLGTAIHHCGQFRMFTGACGGNGGPAAGQAAHLLGCMIFDVTEL